MASQISEPSTVFHDSLPVFCMCQEIDGVKHVSELQFLGGGPKHSLPKFVGKYKGGAQKPVVNGLKL